LHIIAIQQEALSNAIISSNAHLIELDLSDNAFGPDGVKACVKLLTSKACYSLKILRFNNNGLGVGGGKVSILQLNNIVITKSNEDFHMNVKRQMNILVLKTSQHF